MGLPSQAKDTLYNLLKEPSLEAFRAFLKDSTGEHDYLDFKEAYIDGSKLAKEFLSIANYGGGVIIFGVKENDDGSFSCNGIQPLRDKAEIGNSISKYVPSSLNYEIHDFSYDASEYQALIGKSFQIIIVEDNPQFLPYLSKRDGSGIKTSRIYTRRNTECAEADNDEIAQIISRRINYAHPYNGKPLELDEHIKQLRILYQSIDKTNVRYVGGFAETLSLALKGAITGTRIEEDNPYYPEESFEEFISRMIEHKKNKIERFLDLS